MALWWHGRDMQVVIEKLQAGARKAQEVAAKIESPPPTADAADTLVSLPLTCLPIDYQSVCGRLSQAQEILLAN